MISVMGVQDASAIPAVTPAEAEKLSAEEVARLLALLKTLGDDDWAKPTACTLWNVRDMVAHQAGAYASGTGYRELFGQYTAALAPGRLAEDAINERQLAQRKRRRPAELIAEIESAAPPAVHNWAYGFRLLKPVAIPHPAVGWLSMRYLMLVIHSRDTWIHRLDICRATGRAFEQRREHDGRINALVVRDLARKLSPKLGEQAVVLELDGIAGGAWRIGRGRPEASIRMDTLDFNIYASGRFTGDEARQRATLSGDVSLAERAFGAFSVLY